MKILFIHQNLPGQFRHLIFHCARDPGCEVAAIGEKRRILENVKRPIAGVKFYGYDFTPTPRNKVASDLWTTENALRRGRAAAACLKKLRADGFIPDVVYGHPGWGEMIHVRDVFPGARVINYCEFYFNRDEQDYGFDPEFPDTDLDGFRIRTENMTQLVSLVGADAGISPTAWQRSRYPDLFQERISVIHDGIDLDIVKPDAIARVHLPQKSLTLTRGDQVITYVSRNLEPYRGFHIFMRALPEIQRRLPHAHVLIVGGDDVSYGRPSDTGTYREKYLAEVGTRVDMSRVHFLGRLPYADYLRVLQISVAHVYLTYPFVLSWSMLEAMAAGAIVVGSRTAPVQEVVKDGHNGFLVDFFSQAEIVDALAHVCSSAGIDDVRRASIRTIRERFSLREQCLPQLFEALQLRKDLPKQTPLISRA
ncbi:glycosyltransferase [Paraburkholderia sediminicola]|uniref:glycosyltransferase n=1 Tax=Paraburkholderia sediminicola TaxID=458836 RepID=UPI0038BD7F38